MLLVSIKQLVLLLLIQRLNIVTKTLPHRVPVLLGAGASAGRERCHVAPAGRRALAADSPEAPTAALAALRARVQVLIPTVLFGTAITLGIVGTRLLLRGVRGLNHARLSSR